MTQSPNTVGYHWVKEKSYIFLFILLVSLCCLLSNTFLCLFSVYFDLGPLDLNLMYLSISSALKSILFSFHVCLHEISSANQLRHTIAHVCNPTASTFICLGLLIPICFLQSVPLLTFAKIQANSTMASPVKLAFFSLFFFLTALKYFCFPPFSLSLSLLITDMQTQKMLSVRSCLKVPILQETLFHCPRWGKVNWLSLDFDNKLLVQILILKEND